MGPCVGSVGKFICIGLNYADHAAETGADRPDRADPVHEGDQRHHRPATTTSCIPRGSVKTDWEVELGVVIGTTRRYVDESDALDHVAGYCVVNDVSEREFQTRARRQWDKGKGCDTFGPIGPWLVTADEVADPQNLAMWLEVNGHRYQNGSTKTMIFGVAQLRQLRQPVHDAACPAT